MAAEKQSVWVSFDPVHHSHTFYKRATAEQRTCKNCDYCSNGECRKMTPVLCVMKNESGVDQIDTTWPSVQPDDWCAEGGYRE